MMLAFQSPHCFTSFLLPPSHLPNTQSLRSATKLAIRAQSGEEVGVTESEEAATPAASKGLGFGSSTDATKGGKKKKGKERAPVVRRTPIGKPAIVSSDGDSESEKERTNQRAFLLTWLGFGILILVEGIALAASGLLPEEWDSFFVKYLYPSFTPTVFLFVGGTVAYGLLKYIQSEKLPKN